MFAYLILKRKIQEVSEGAIVRHGCFHQKILKSWRRPTLPQVNAVPSALESLTAVFGMGTGVPSPLLSPGFLHAINNYELIIKNYC